MSPAANSGSTAQPAAPEQPKSTWEKVITSTPILLTVVATLLAGISSSEMTRSQYFRAVAAQNQSKVSDQWNFFQAKRGSGRTMDLAVIQLRSTSSAGKLSPDSLKTSTQRLSEHVKRAETDAHALEVAVGVAGFGPTGKVRAAAEQFRADTKAAIAASDKVIAKLDALAKVTPKNPLTYLIAGTVPERVERTAEQREELNKGLEKIQPEIRKSLRYFDPGLLKGVNDENTAIPEALWEVNERKTEREMHDTLPKITEAQIHKAIDEGEKTAREFEDACGPITDAFRDLDKLITDLTDTVMKLYESSQEVTLTATLAQGESKPNDVQQKAAALALTTSTLNTATHKFANSYKVAQLVYDSRRYEREARDNQAVAGLYELDVRKASLESDRHRQRSSNFYAMLAAQGGVTIATFSIAMRRKSLLWGLATAAGLAAITFGGYVFLTM